jgi:DNA anti-recombination protein RmuC
VSVETSDEIVEGTGGGQSYSEVGAGVAAILEAAEQAAEKIRADARSQGTDLIREAEQAVGARLQALTQDAERLRNEADARAEQIRAEAESEARDLRLAAEAYGKRLRVEAEEEVAKIVRRAEDRAAEILANVEERAAEAAQQAEARFGHLSEEVRELEARRQRVVEALRKISNAIGDVVTVDEGRNHDSELDEALDPSARRARGRIRR